MLFKRVFIHNVPNNLFASSFLINLNVILLHIAHYDKKFLSVASF